MKHFENEGKWMIGFPVALVALAVLAAFVIPNLL